MGPPLTVLIVHCTIPGCHTLILIVDVLHNFLANGSKVSRRGEAAFQIRARVRSLEASMLLCLPLGDLTALQLRLSDTQTNAAPSMVPEQLVGAEG